MLVARLDACIMTVIDLMKPMTVPSGAPGKSTAEINIQNQGFNRKKKNFAGYCRQKLYSEKYASFLKLATDQLIGEIRSFVMKWAPEEVVPQGKIDCKYDNDCRAQDLVSFLNMERHHTKLFDVPSEGKVYVSISSDFFSKYICSYIGDVHDCYVTCIDEEKKEWKLLGLSTTVFYTEMPLENDSD